MFLERLKNLLTSRYDYSEEEAMTLMTNNPDIVTSGEICNLLGATAEALFLANEKYYDNNCGRGCGGGCC